MICLEEAKVVIQKLDSIGGYADEATIDRQANEPSHSLC